MAALLTIVVFFRPTDPDLWWHLKTGELIVEGQRFFSSDPFSWTATGRTWYLHEWLSEAVLYWIQANVSFALDTALTAAVVVATLAIVYRLALRIYPREIIVLGLVFLSAVIIAEFARVRPQVVTWLFFAIFFRQLYLSYRGEQVLLWPLPLLMVLWANMHLGYLFGLMAVYVWLGSLVLREGLSGLRTLRGPALLAAACTLAPVVSPIGPRAVLTPFAYIGSDQVAIGAIKEWQSPNFHSPDSAPFLLALAVIVAVGLPWGRRHLFTLLLTVAVVVESLISQRNFPLLAVMLPIVVAASAAQRWPAADLPIRMGANAVNWGIAGALALGTIVAVIAMGGQIEQHPKTDSDLPSQGVAYLRHHHLGERMYNSYNWGGYLIAQLYPDVKVSIDGRSDLYGDEIFQRYLDISSLKRGWRDELRRLDPDFIFIEKRSTLSTQLLDSDEGWVLAFEGPVEAIFVPADRAAAAAE